MRMPFKRAAERLAEMAVSGGPELVAGPWLW